MISSLEIGPILRTLLRNKVGALLIALQIALTMTIVVNAIFIIGERESMMARDSGIDEMDTFTVDSRGFSSDFNVQQTIKEDLRQMRSLPGVKNATQINAIPLSGGGWSNGIQTEPGEDKEDLGIAVYMVDEAGLDTLDLELILGRNFNADEIRFRDGSEEAWPQSIIITQAGAKAVFPDLSLAEIVGKTIYISSNDPAEIIGIVDKLQAPWNSWDGVEYAFLSPEHIAYDNSSRYLIRAEDGMRDQAMRTVEEYLSERASERLVMDMRSFEDIRQESYSRDDAMIKILSIVMVTLVIITGMGIIGLASFNVNRRKKQIGTRRALGASQLNIVRYFMLENFIITSIGVIIGAALTIGLNMVLISHFELGRLEWFYVPAGMICLWLLGQIAVFGPAKKAANIPPALATRTV